ncbi:DUF4112 domain-containing protein [Kordiimonas aquimaris]|uniref:DUF4112 domain-containing protein n=1 Tax=Kordiimonas aquimaris TaxID=707591 RepID=UPI0021D11986|nr:DUF4112 domain-containing protein [Kordiimonas aquimaris]
MLKHEKRVRRVQNLAQLLDRKYRIPGTRFRFGLDALIGLIPGVGDTITAVLAGWIIYQAHKCGVPFSIKLRMAVNVFIDWFIGLIPLLGDLFDIGWQANYRNAQLLSGYLEN